MEEHGSADLRPPSRALADLASSLNMSSGKTPTKHPSQIQRSGSNPEAAGEHYPFSDLNVEDCIMDQLSWSASWSMMQSSSGLGSTCEKVNLSTTGQSAAWQVMSLRYKAVHSAAVCASLSSGANAHLDPQESDLPPHRVKVPHDLQAMKHRADVLSRTPAESTGHSSAACASPSSGANAPLDPRESDPPPHRALVPPAEDRRERILAKWQARSLRYKAAHSPAFCASPSSIANAALDPRESDPLPHRANVPHAEDLRARVPRIEMIFLRTPARSISPIVLSAPLHLPETFHTRVAMKLTMQAVGADSRTRAFSRYVGAPFSPA